MGKKKDVKTTLCFQTTGLTGVSGVMLLEHCLSKSERKKKKISCLPKSYWSFGHSTFVVGITDFLLVEQEEGRTGRDLTIAAWTDINLLKLMEVRFKPSCRRMLSIPPPSLIFIPSPVVSVEENVDANPTVSLCISFVFPRHALIEPAVLSILTRDIW